MDPSTKQQELATLRERVEQLESELAVHSDADWPPKKFYASYYATTGFLLGGIAAGVSLLVNVLAAPIAGKPPLELIRVYLTFPLGAKALSLTEGAQGAFAVSDGVIISLGCTLYLLTGMLLGVPLFVGLMYFAGEKTLLARVVIGSGLALGLWIINFYVILHQLQPAILGGNWITDSQVLPWWVAAATHLVFGVTMAVLSPLGRFRPYHRNQES